jgi:CRISPR system Cascade subunit CasC
MLVQIHLLQNYAPANLNRDDTGSPKDALFGGYRRGRISSQCLKRSIRKSAVFAEAFEKEGLLGIRTKQLPDLIKGELVALAADDEALRAIMARLSEIGRESSKGKAAEEETEDASSEPRAQVETETKQLIFIGRSELRPLAEKLLALYREQGSKKWAKLKIGEITKSLGQSLPRSVDIAMFGRMTTSDAFDDVSAAVQVAHALSTNALTQEFDYYTAMDDLSGESGADMIGDVEFNSSTYYKYLNVHWEQLVENLGGDVAVGRRAVLALIEAAATAQPSGKQNTFAANNLPDLVLVEISERNLPVSYANAFLKPSRPSGERSLMDVSATKLADYMTQIGKTFGLQSKRAFIATQDYTLPGAESRLSLADLQGWIQSQITEA